MIRVFVITLIAALVVLTGLASLPAHSQTACRALPDALAALSTQYGESPRSTGLMGNGSLLIITASDRGGVDGIDRHARRAGLHGGGW